MLYSMDQNNYVQRVPHYKDYRRWRARLSDADYRGVMAAIDRAVDSGNVCTAGWIPGNDWADTPWQSIAEACQNRAESGLFFGLLVFENLMLRTDRVWGFGRFEKNGEAIGSMTYFELRKPPAR